MRRSCSGFTLIELMAAAAATVLIAALTLQTTSRALANWEQARERLMLDMRAERVLDELEQELAAMCPSSDGAAWCVATVLPSTAETGARESWSGRTKPSGTESLRLTDATSPEALRFGQRGMWVRWFATLPDTNADERTLSAPRAISWRLVRMAGAEGGRYGLARASLPPGGENSCFASGFDLLADAYRRGSARATAGGRLYAVGSADVVFPDVIDFGICLYRRDANGALGRIFPTVSAEGHTFAATVKRGRVPPDDPAAIMVTEVPDAAEICIRVLTAEGVRGVNAFEQGRIDGGWWKWAMAHSRVYTRRVSFPCRPL